MLIELDYEEKFLDNTDLRLGFIRKVYGILTFKLLLTSILCLFS